MVLIIDEFNAYDDTALLFPIFPRKGKLWNLKQSDINIR